MFSKKSTQNMSLPTVEYTRPNSEQLVSP